jgi:hypothetical protein
MTMLYQIAVVIVLASNLAAWWFLIWILARRTKTFMGLIFIPTAICSLGIPMLIDDIPPYGSHSVHLQVWFAVPYCSLLVVYIFRILAKRKAMPSAK